MKEVIAAEQYDNESNEIQCLNHLLTSLCDSYKDGRKRTIGDWVSQAAGIDNTESNEGGADNANKVIAAYGLKVDNEYLSGDKMTQCLLVATKHQGLAKIFKETAWAEGVWTQALRRLKGAQPYKTRRFGGVSSKCTIIPMDSIIGD